MKRIHWSKIWAVMGKKDAAGRSVPFTMEYVKKSTGEKKEYLNCRLSSIHTKGVTVNIKIDGDIEPQTYRKCLITKFNGMSVYI